MTVYVRNWRPNAVQFKHAGVKILLQRRGTRDDNVALPDEALSNGVIARYLRTGKLERISEEAYFLLASRDEDEKMPALQQRKIEKVAINNKPTNPDSPLERTPTFVEAYDNREVRSPNLEWETPPEPTFPPYQGSDKDKALPQNDPFGLTSKKPGAKRKTTKKAE